MVFPSEQSFRPGPPKPSAVKRPGVFTLSPGEERYTVPGGGTIAVPIHAGDRLLTGADVVVTANAGCILQIQREARQQRKRLAVAHPMDLLDLSYRGAAFK